MNFVSRTLPFFCFAAAGVLLAPAWVQGAAEPKPPPDLPFTAEGVTTGPLAMTVRHKVQLDLRGGAIAWDRFEADFPGDVRLSARPGRFDPNAAEPQTVALRLDVRRGNLTADLRRLPDGAWTAPIAFDLEPRDAAWKEPRISLQQIAAEGALTLDGRLSGGPLDPIREIGLQPLTIRKLRAGPYLMENVRLQAAWDRPDWNIEKASLRTFGGRIDLSGEGTWGTSEPLPVSLNLEVEGIEVQPLLRAFDLPRAEQIAGRLDGFVHLKAKGREFEKLDFVLTGRDVAMHRNLLYEAILVQLFDIGAITPEQWDQTLRGTFGDEKMIPFERMSVQGELRPKILHVKMPLQNRALDITTEYNIDRPLVWQFYDRILDTGLQKVESVELESPGE